MTTGADAVYKVRLDVFEGPLDLLLYLIKKSELDIHDIPINVITEKYLEYLHLMELLDLNIAGEFLVMAATLMQIKSRMLLPQAEVTPPQEEEDPREELVKRLLEYKKFKDAAMNLQAKEKVRADSFVRFPGTVEMDAGDSPFLEASLFDLISAFSKVLKDMPRDAFHKIIKDEFSVAEKVHEIFHVLVDKSRILFSALFTKAANKLEMVTIFMAILELIRLKEVVIRQNRLFEDIEILKNTDNIVPPKSLERETE